MLKRVFSHMKEYKKYAWLGLLCIGVEVVFLVALPTLAVFLILIIINVGPLYGRMQSAIDQVNRCIQENLTAIRVVKSYVRGDYEVEKFGVVNENLKSESEKAFGTAVLNMPAMQFVMYGTILGILLIGGRLINEGQMMIGQLTSFLSYVLLILNFRVILLKSVKRVILTSQFSYRDDERKCQTHYFRFRYPRNQAPFDASDAQNENVARLS